MVDVKATRYSSIDGWRHTHIFQRAQVIHTRPAHTDFVRREIRAHVRPCSDVVRSPCDKLVVVVGGIKRVTGEHARRVRRDVVEHRNSIGIIRLANNSGIDGDVVCHDAVGEPSVVGPHVSYVDGSCAACGRVIDDGVIGDDDVAERHPRLFWPARNCVGGTAGELPRMNKDVVVNVGVVVASTR